MGPLDLRVLGVRVVFQEYPEKLDLQDQMGQLDHAVPLEEMVREVIRRKDKKTENAIKIKKRQHRKK